MGWQVTWSKPFWRLVALMADHAAAAAAAIAIIIQHNCHSNMNYERERTRGGPPALGKKKEEGIFTCGEADRSSRD